MRHSSPALLVLTIAVLVALTTQGWMGDYVNLFAVFPVGPVGHTLHALSQALIGAGHMAVAHAILGIVLEVLAIAVLVIVFRFNAGKGARIFAILGFLAVLSAVYGGMSFVFSGFQDNGNSAQMGGSFIGAYASYFLVLYFSKNKAKA